jgi:hypothetical protein
MKETGVYCILNEVTGKCYVGSASVSFDLRWARHKRNLKGNYHFNKHLQRAWNKYGEKNFSFLVLEIVEPSRCLEREQWFINNLKPEYNICANVESPTLGRKHSIETKRKMALFDRSNQIYHSGKSHAKSIPVIYQNLKTGEEKTFDNILKCANFIGMPRHTLSALLKREGTEKQNKGPKNSLIKLGISVKYLKEKCDSPTVR